MQEPLQSYQQFDISKSAIHLTHERSADELMKKNKRLEEMNAVMEEQNLSWKAENEKLNAEIQELQAFLDDIEAQSDLKSMMGIYGAYESILFISM